MSFEPAPVGNGLSKDDKAKKLALQHWLEAISHTLDHTNDLKLFNMPPLPPQKIVKIAACLLRESNLRYGLQTHLEGAQRSTRKNFKPARHPDATNADDHDEGHNFINIEEEEQEIDQAEIDETSDCDWQRRKNTDLTALREKERKIKLSLCPTMKD
ncbi:hypothetical protein JHK86_039717 [Glycine max]|nr:hypothetical protein JHK86_039717 [Glycine max]